TRWAAWGGTVGTARRSPGPPWPEAGCGAATAGRASPSPCRTLLAPRRRRGRRRSLVVPHVHHATEPARSAVPDRRGSALLLRLAGTGRHRAARVPPRGCGIGSPDRCLGRVGGPILDRRRRRAGRPGGGAGGPASRTGGDAGRRGGRGTGARDVPGRVGHVDSLGDQALADLTPAGLALLEPRDD